MYIYVYTHTHNNKKRIIKNNKNTNPWFGAIPFSTVKKSGSFFSLSSSTMSSDLEQRESQMILSLERVRNYTEKKKLFKHVITKPISLKKKNTQKKL